MEVTCWAKALGNCSHLQSGEHIVSAAIFSSASIEVTGAIWRAETTPKVIGRSSLTANILCTHHNSELSPVDSAAGLAIQAIRDFTAACDRRSTLEPRQWPFIYLSRAHGPLFERFLVKTLINMLVARNPDHLWPQQHAHDNPPLYLIQAAFGVRSLSWPAGVYFQGQVGDQIKERRDGLEALSLISDTNECHGAAFLLRGFPFFLWLVEDRIPRDVFNFSTSRILYHPRRVIGTVAHVPSHELLFEGWSAGA